MFFVGAAVLLVVAGVGSLMLTARYRRSWRAWLSLLALGLLALYGAAFIYGAPVLV